MNTQITKLLVPIYLTSALLGSTVTNCLAAGAQTLKGGVNQSDVIKNNGPALNRGDMGKGADPFSSGGDQKPDDGGMLEAPPGAFDNKSVFEGTPKPFQMDAQEEGGGGFKGQNMNPEAEPSNEPTNLNTQQNAPFQSGTQESADPEQSRQMQLLWDAWHKRVAETIYVRFNNSAQMFFRHSKPVGAQVGYMVASDGRIGNVRILQASNNPVFDTMLITIIKSIEHNQVLQFPPNTRRKFVEKTGTFTWNYTGGQGYKYLTGDKETVQQKGR